MGWKGCTTERASAGRPLAAQAQLGLFELENVNATVWPATRQSQIAQPMRVALGELASQKFGRKVALPEWASILRVSSIPRRKDARRLASALMAKSLFQGKGYHPAYYGVVFVSSNPPGGPFFGSNAVTGFGSAPNSGLTCVLLRWSVSPVPTPTRPRRSLRSRSACQGRPRP